MTPPSPALEARYLQDIRIALEQCAKWFYEYEEHHRTKGDAEKAMRNLSRATVANDALRLANSLTAAGLLASPERGVDARGIMEHACRRSGCVAATDVVRLVELIECDLFSARVSASAPVVPKAEGVNQDAVPTVILRMLRYAERFEKAGNKPHAQTIRGWVRELSEPKAEGDSGAEIEPTLPCTVTVGAATFGKGVKVATLQACIHRLHNAYCESTKQDTKQMTEELRRILGPGW